MRREFVIFAAILGIVLVAGLFGRFLITGIAVEEVKNAFQGYDVSIGGVEVRSADMIAITGINAKKAGISSCRIQALEVKFSLLSLFTRKVQKITVKNAYLEVSSRDKKLKDIIGHPVFKTGKGFIAKSVVISNFNLVLDTADWKTDVIVDGDIEMRKAATGGPEIEGDFNTIASATGILAIRDEVFLKKLAENAKQPPAAIEDLKDFDFTKGTLKISGKPGSLLFHVTLEGAKGKKDLAFPLRGL